MAAETNDIALKEALCAQQRLLQKLYNELDVEREASATAASEALSMILRLQGEKSAVKMEAEQYKRLAEAKMHYAEESMEIFQDLIYQKEMEIASLEHQLQAYRYKLSSLGFEDLGVTEIKLSEDSLEQNETLVGETYPKILARGNSAPPKLLKLAFLKKGSLERNRSISPESDNISRIVEENALEDENRPNSDSENKTDGSSPVDVSSYWDQIRKLSKIVKEMAGEQHSSFMTSSSSMASQLGSDRSQSPKKSLDDELLSDTCSASVHDVFEVPQVDESPVSCKNPAKDDGKSIFEGDNIRKLVNFPKLARKSYVKEVTELGKKTLLLKHKDKQVFLPRDNIAIDCQLALDLPATDVVNAQGLSQQMNRTTEITEEQVTSAGGEEVLSLLYEIREKLNSIQSQIRSCKTETKKSSPNYDGPMLQLKEAMLHFWL